MPQQITLCSPDAEKSCFACCPPIRPSNYEHVQYRNIIKRILRENTRAFRLAPCHMKPITGFSCWALGYMDDGFKIIGCLLHPARHGGRDLRHMTGYGEKCRRESCPESRTFTELSQEAQRFFLGLTTNLDSFQYSSRRHNPLFRLLGWGAYILERVYQELSQDDCEAFTLLERYPVLLNTLYPRASAYVLRHIVDQLGTHAIKGQEFGAMFAKLCRSIFAIYPELELLDGNSFTHQLGMDKDFQDLIRLGMGIKKINNDAASLLKERIDQRLALFVSKSYPGD